MENNLIPMKYRLRKTDEQVEVIEHNTVEKGARNDNDWVSFIDSQGGEHIKEHLTLEWDFILESPFENSLLNLSTSLTDIDIWETRRYELVKTMVIDQGHDIDVSIRKVDYIIDKLKPRS